MVMGHPLSFLGQKEVVWGPPCDLQFESPPTSASSENPTPAAHAQGRFHGNKEGDAHTCVQATATEIAATCQPLIMYHLDSHPIPCQAPRSDPLKSVLDLM